MDECKNKKDRPFAQFSEMMTKTKAKHLNNNIFSNHVLNYRRSRTSSTGHLLYLIIQHN